MAQKRRTTGGRVTPSPRTATPKARVPTSSRPLKGSTRKGGADGTTQTRNPATHDEGSAQPALDETTDDGEPAARVWGLGDVAAWFFGALALSFAAQLAFGGWLLSRGYVPVWPDDSGSALGQVAGQLGSGKQPEVTRGLNALPIGVQALMQIPLWAMLIAAPFFVARRKGADLVRDFKFAMRPVDVPLGVAVGLASQLLLMPALFWLVFRLIGEQDVSEPVRRYTNQVNSPLSAVLLLIVVGLGAPIAEEVFFRGLTQAAAIKRFGVGLGIVVGAAIFGASHFQLLQLPGLFVFGLVLGWITHRFQRIGPAIWAHLAFNITAVIAVLGNRFVP